MWRGVLRFSTGPRLSLEDELALARQLHFLARNPLDGRWISLKRLHPILQPLVFFIESRDIFSNPLCFFLRLPHGQHAMRAENVLEQQQSETYDQEQIHVALEELAELFKEPKTRFIGLFFDRFRLANLRPLAS